MWAFLAVIAAIIVVGLIEALPLEVRDLLGLIAALAITGGLFLIVALLIKGLGE